MHQFQTTPCLGGMCVIAMRSDIKGYLGAFWKYYGRNIIDNFISYFNHHFSDLLVTFLDRNNRRLYSCDGNTHERCHPRGRIRSVSRTPDIIIITAIRESMPSKTYIVQWLIPWQCLSLQAYTRRDKLDYSCRTLVCLLIDATVPCFTQLLYFSVSIDRRNSTLFYQLSYSNVSTDRRNRTLFYPDVVL